MEYKACPAGIGADLPTATAHNPGAGENRCAVCLDMFRQNLHQLDALLAELDQEQADGRELVANLKTTFRNFLLDAIPAEAPEVIVDNTNDFHSGWSRCRDDVTRRVEALLSTLD